MEWSDLVNTEVTKDVKEDKKAFKEEKCKEIEKFRDNSKQWMWNGTKLWTNWPASGCQEQM